jgi:magnesium chelatase subunit D
MTPASDAWLDAALAASLVAVDPVGLGGVSLRAGAGSERERWLALLHAALPATAPLRRVPHNAGDDGLLGGLDLSATLHAGRPIAQCGALAQADGGIVLLGMAERAAPTTAARFAAVLDEGMVTLQRDGLALQLPARIGLVALDEGLADDERPPEALLDRLAFHVDLRAVGSMVGPTSGVPADAAGTIAARARLASVQVAADFVHALCTVALALGVASMRAPILAVRAAVAMAALAGRSAVIEEDAAVAARLVLAPRATMMPDALPRDATDPRPADAPEEELPKANAPQTEPENTEPPELGPQQSEAPADRPLTDVVLDAVRAALPPDALARLRAADSPAGSKARPRSIGRAGVQQCSLRRGKPIGALAGELRSGARLHLVETLKAAAPWQLLRGATRGPRTRLAVRRSDFRIVRFRHRSETLMIFAVDASGSSALHRLAEAKGAIELLLASCYVRRDKVALIAFRGRAAELLLAPTGALVRAKRCLAGLPGGGATPLAAGLDAAALLADAARRKGQTPILTVLTDGRGNVARDGSYDRARAEVDAIAAARRIRAGGFAVLLVDTAARPDERTRRLGVALGASYLPLPCADAARLSQAVRAAARPSAASPPGIASRAI